MMMWNIFIFPFVCLTLSVLYNYYYGTPINIVENPANNYDYIIVGAGTAGCVIASQLSKSGNASVLLIEAGGYFKWFSSVPLAAPLLQGTDANWAYQTEPQTFSSRGLRDQKQFVPRGKGLGGSGQMNYLLHSFGIPEDYANWPVGWSYADLLPYFKRTEDAMVVTTVSVKEELARAFHNAGIEISRENTSLILARHTLKNGARWSSYNAYLNKAWDRENLHILINTFVTKIIFDKLTARAVQIQHPNGTMDQIKANREIILCGGAFNTPQLLLLSGIGPANELKKYRIPVVSHLEKVGENLFDHLNVPIYIGLKTPVSVTLNKLMSLSEIFKYYAFGSGLLASTAILGTGITGHSGIVFFGMGSADESLLKDIANFHTTVKTSTDFGRMFAFHPTFEQTQSVISFCGIQTFRAIFPSYANSKQEGFIYLANCLQPKSRGRVTLGSSHFSDPPIIDPRYLQNDYDVTCTHKAINLAMDTLRTRQFMELGVTPHIPNLDECNHLKPDYSNLEFTNCLTRTAGLTSHHFGGTCQMGNRHDNRAVVDEHLRVIGVNGVRIVDASILPSPISGMPNSVIIAMAERAADIIMKIK
ncbi:neither inactivation nor afterpotential protein G-like isoform X1 [Neodiprion virginianus]|uniref:neither inactivation nor afterpotential protein G-like isoform X1 n=1 Tax=Neodiprion virginianus TaxID=2961670 RepID=UPI001EE77E60|nr:neither inactivation nor afterpotential protein G-like isoform X1 [Neodiprion virginianus]